MSKLLEVFTKNKPGLLIGLGIGSMMMATLTGIRYAPEARDALDMKKRELGVDRLSAKDTIKTVGGFFVPSIAFTGVGIACIMSGNQMNVDSKAAAIAAYAISESTLRDYREKTKEIVGEKKERDIQEAIAKDTVRDNPATNSTVIVTGNGDCLCYDKVANQHFRSSKVRIESVINSINFDMLHGQDVVSLNEYCARLGLDEVELGNNLGWDVCSNGLISVTFTAVVTSTGEPCLVILHNTTPEVIK